MKEQFFSAGGWREEPSGQGRPGLRSTPKRSSGGSDGRKGCRSICGEADVGEEEVGSARSPACEEKLTGGATTDGTEWRRTASPRQGRLSDQVELAMAGPEQWRAQRRRH